MIHSGEVGQKSKKKLSTQFFECPLQDGYLWHPSLFLKHEGGKLKVLHLDGKRTTFELEF